MPAGEEELKIASILYYQAYQEDLPLLNYRKQDVEYIIEQLQVKLSNGTDVFDSVLLH
ncbi:hypothetical protein [Cytobacillus oceanisediminis]|uniref:Uncharacterized protein n=1 Tax=Cytobacillus oceanisediminis TaxID=665099 RepID=A0A562JGM3_9BACI|nr:hypothetical protein [Cytobacillus oceanisediminis]TWH82300.1 hypothetical protein IQ19_04152 [Cytobacillus oceanisediminis]